MDTPAFNQGATSAAGAAAQPASKSDVSDISLKRIKREIVVLKQESNGRYRVDLDPTNDHHWTVKFNGPSRSAYEGGRFKVDVVFPTSYPSDPPSVVFLTKIYHCNINDKGQVAHPALKKNVDWSPALSMLKLLDAICVEMLLEPFENEPLVPSIANEYRNDKSKFVQVAKEWTSKYAADDEGKDQE